MSRWRRLRCRLGLHGVSWNRIGPVIRIPLPGGGHMDKGDVYVGTCVRCGKRFIDDGGDPMGDR